jgi:hypothetical protein
MHIPLALLVEHDIVDYVNAASTVVVALFTVSMFAVVGYQLKASKDIERAWLMVKVERDTSNSLFLSENTSREKNGKELHVTLACLRLTFRNDGNGPIWVKRLQTRMVMLDSVEQLPKHPEFNKDDDQKRLPPPFVKEDYTSVQLTAEGSLYPGKEVVLPNGRITREAVVYGRITYLDKFRQERVSTFGYALHSAGHGVERLQSHPEYNRNT